LLIDSTAHVHNDGGEMFATWSITRRWKLAPGLALVRTKVSLEPGSHDVYAQSTADSSPRLQFPLRSSLVLTRTSTGMPVSRITANCPAKEFPDTPG